MDSWPEKEAEARFGEMLERCLAEGPQIVTREEAEAAVLVSLREGMRPASVTRSNDNRSGSSLKEWLMTDFARGDNPTWNEGHSSSGHPTSTIDVSLRRERRLRATPHSAPRRRNGLGLDSRA